MQNSADGWEDRCVKSSFKSSDEGPWELSAGKFSGDPDNKGNVSRNCVSCSVVEADSYSESEVRVWVRESVRCATGSRKEAD